MHTLGLARKNAVTASVRMIPRHMEQSSRTFPKTVWNGTGADNYNKVRSIHLLEKSICIVSAESQARIVGALVGHEVTRRTGVCRL